MGGMDVRGPLSRSPWWVLSLVSGALFGLFTFARQLIDDESLARSAIVAAAAGVFFGLFFGLIMGRRLRRMGDRSRAAMGELPAVKQRQAGRAVMRGPVPADPDVRRAALDLITDQIDTYRRLRWAILMWVFFIAVSLWLAVSDGGWSILSVVLFTGFLVMQLWAPWHLERRRLLLAKADVQP